jgi:hypothetical protein
MACGFLYLVAIIDWASRAVLAWRLLRRDNQDENRPTIRMRIRRREDSEGRA